MKLKNIFSLSMLFIMPLTTANLAYADQLCIPQATKTAPDSRFTISTDGKEVTDNKTGLIWQRCSIGQSWNGSGCQGSAENLTWKQALTKAKALGNGYRLPNIREAMSLIEMQCRFPALNTTVFPNFPTPDPDNPYKFTLYWTSTPIKSQGNQAYLFDYANGSGMMHTSSDKTSALDGYLESYAIAVRHK